jgi:UDP-glucose 4-epimerase
MGGIGPPATVVASHSLHPQPDRATRIKVLVTGGAGFIGSHVVDLYLEQGFEVVVVDDLSSGRMANVNPKARFFQLDIRSPDLAHLFESERPDVVNHHAGQSSIRRSLKDPVFDAQVNLLGSLNLLECCRVYDVRQVIHISSGGAVYGEPKYLPCDESHPLEPISPYGASKLAVEKYLHIYQVNYGLKYVVLRYPNVYGPRQDPCGEAGVVAIFACQMLAGEQVVINGDGEQQRDFVYVADCARANLLALDRAQAGSVYNLGSGRGTTVNEIATALQRIIGYQRRPVHGPEWMAEVRRIHLDAEKARRELDWELKVALPEGLQRTVEYFQTASAAA